MNFISEHGVSMAKTPLAFNCNGNSRSAVGQLHQKSQSAQEMILKGWSHGIIIKEQERGSAWFCVRAGVLLKLYNLLYTV